MGSAGNRAGPEVIVGGIKMVAEDLPAPNCALILSSELRAIWKLFGQVFLLFVLRKATLNDVHLSPGPNSKL